MSGGTVGRGEKQKRRTRDRESWGGEDKSGREGRSIKGFSEYDTVIESKQNHNTFSYSWIYFDVHVILCMI